MYEWHVPMLYLSIGNLKIWREQDCWFIEVLYISGFTHRAASCWTLSSRESEQSERRIGHFSVTYEWASTAAPQDNFRGFGERRSKISDNPPALGKPSIIKTNLKWKYQQTKEGEVFKWDIQRKQWADWAGKSLLLISISKRTWIHLNSCHQTCKNEWKHKCNIHCHH